MPSTIKPHPDTLYVDDKNAPPVLVGTGERSVRLGIATIYVYSLGLYVDGEKCRSCLSDIIGVTDHNALLRIPNFYTRFVDSKFQKTFRLVFCRSLSKSKLVGGFSSSLKSRCGEEDPVEEFLNSLIVDEGVKDNDVLTVFCQDDGTTIQASFTSNDETQQLLDMKSTGIWKAFQNLFFDDQTSVPTIRHGAVSLLPNVLTPQEDNEGDTSDTAKLVDEAIEEQFVKGNGSYLDWSKFSGREDGNKGYKFGDLTRGVSRKVINTAYAAGSYAGNTAYAAGSYTYSASIGKAFSKSDVNVVAKDDDAHNKDEKDIQIERHLEMIQTLAKDTKTKEDRLLKLENDLGRFQLILILWIVSDVIWSSFYVVSRGFDSQSFLKGIIFWVAIKSILFLVMSPIIKSPKLVKKVMEKLKLQKSKID